MAYHAYRLRRFTLALLLCTASANWAHAQSAAPPPSSATCGDEAVLRRLSEAPTSSAVWRPVLRTLRPPRASRRNDVTCDAAAVRVHRFWPESALSGCASLVVAMEQECDYAYEVESFPVTSYARLSVGARDRVMVSGRHEIDWQETFVDPIVERGVTTVADVATGTYHFIGQRPPIWLIADPALPDLDNDGWNETLFLGAGDYWCAVDDDSSECCASKQTAFLGSSRDGRALSSEIYYSGSEIPPEARRRATEYWATNYSCDPTPRYESYDAPRSFAVSQASSAGAVRFTASRVVHACVGLNDTACAPGTHRMSDLDFTVPTPNTWRASIFEGGQVFFAVEAANIRLPLRASLTPGSAYFTSGAPALIADVTERIPRVFVRYSTVAGRTGGNSGVLAVERPNGSLETLRQVADQAAELRNLSPGRHRFFWLSSEERDHDNVLLAFRSDLPPDRTHDTPVVAPEEVSGAASAASGQVPTEPLAAAVSRTVTENRENRESLQVCYRGLVQTHPQPATIATIRIVVTLEIDPSGSVISATAGEDGVPPVPPVLAACIERATSQWRFPPSSDGGRMRFPVVFTGEPTPGGRTQ